jgi:hypothetical protein
MKLEEQIVSLELAEKLKELGVKQDSLFYWSLNEHRNVGWNVFYEFESFGPDEWFARDLEKHISAFTVAELGLLLKDFSVSASTWRDNKSGKWDVLVDHEILIGSVDLASETEADTRAKMLIYLLKNKLITLS